MESHEDHAPEAPPAAEDTRIDGEIIAALRDATYGLTDDGIGAVVAIRRYRAILSSLEHLILVGKLEAERRPGVSEDTVLSVHNYVFRALSDEEQAQLRTLENGAPGEELVS
jgi:hypothetical protein